MVKKEGKKDRERIKTVYCEFSNSVIHNPNGRNTDWSLLDRDIHTGSAGTLKRPVNQSSINHQSTTRSINHFLIPINPPLTRTHPLE
jgi:hypothetical protein